MKKEYNSYQSLLGLSPGPLRLVGLEDQISEEIPRKHKEIVCTGKLKCGLDCEERVSHREDNHISDGVPAADVDDIRSMESDNWATNLLKDDG